MTKIKTQHGKKEFDEKYFRRVLKKTNFKELQRLSRMFYGWFSFINLYIPLKSFPSKKALEIGCHIGAFSKVLSDRGFKVKACDISEYILSQAKQINSKVKFFPLDISKKHIPEKFDCIFAFEVLEHVENPPIALVHIKKMLVKNGKFIFSTPYPCKQALSDPTHINVHEPDWWINRCKKIGFKNIRFTYVLFVPYLYKFSKFFSIGIPIKINSSLLGISSTTMFFMEI